MSEKAVKVDASSAAVPVTDNSGSLTVDAPVGTPVAIRESDGTNFLTPGTNFDLDTSGGTQNVLGVSLRQAASGGSVGPILGYVRSLITNQHTQIVNSTAETTILTAGGAGVFLDLSCLVLTNQSATAVNVTIKDATTGTTRMIIALGAVGSNSAVVIPFPVPVPQAASNNNWTATLSSGVVTVNILAIAVENI